VSTRRRAVRRRRGRDRDPKSQRDRIKNIKGLIADIEEEYQEGAPVEEVLDRAGEIGMDPGKAEREIEKLRTKGEVYEPQQGHLRTT